MRTTAAAPSPLMAICVAMIISAAGCPQPPVARSRVYDLTKPEDNFEAFMKVRADLTGGETIFHWTGGIFSFVPGKRSLLLFEFEGFNVAVALKVEDGYRLLTREAAFYTHPETGEILETWRNPFTGREVKVVHVWNDPVNSYIKYRGERGPTILSATALGDDTLCWNMDIFLRYPSPLPRAEYPLYSQDDFYEAAESFQFFHSRGDLEDASLSSVPCAVSWTRIGPWLPFMEMADRPGKLVYQCRGAKLSGGFESLPEKIKALVRQEHPEFEHAPSPEEGFDKSNETSWTYFKRRLRQRESAGESER